MFSMPSFIYDCNMSFRTHGFTYQCTCQERCCNQTEPVCTISKNRRSACKYCRFTRCETLAGMVQRWVISAYKPRVRCRQSKHKKLNTDIDVKGEAKNRKLYSEEKLEVAQSSMKDLFQKFDQTILFDSEVTIYLYILYIHMYVYL